MGEASYATVERPSHVGEEFVVDFDYLHPKGLEEGDNYTVLRGLQDGPDIRWTPRNGGHWIVTRYEDIRWVQETYSIFSHEVFGIPRDINLMKIPPISVDPPFHARYRAVLNPFFTPSKVAEIGIKARAVTIELIDKIRPRGRCEFVSDFGHVMPVIMFLSIVDLPIERREEFIELGMTQLRASDQGTRARSLKSISDYLTKVLNERYTNPGKDLFSAIAAWRDNPRFGNEDEVIGMALVVFLGGLDTVASLLSFVTRHLAQHPEHRRRLREEPEIIPRAVEEFLRRFGLSNSGRLILSDVERKGATMKKDEMIMVPIGCSSIDDRKYPDPFTIDFDRPENFDRNMPTHNTFGNGPHKCVGAHLARAEVKIFLEEWLHRIPDFRLDAEHPTKAQLGPVPGLDHLHLLWDVWRA